MSRGIYDDCPLQLRDRHIRILDLDVVHASRTRDDLPLHASLRVASLEPNPPAYHAISYAWGDASHVTPIIINGSPCLITKSLDSGLRAIATAYAREQTSLPLWADAVCIDQSNHEEKGHQVLLMHQIYSKAEKTIAWLGPEADASDKAIDLIETMSEEERDSKSREAFYGAMRELYNEPNHIKAWVAYSILSDRAWFKRLWVVQEFASSPNLDFLCGARIISERNLVSVSRAFLEAIDFDSTAGLVPHPGVPTFNGVPGMLDLKAAVKASAGLVKPVESIYRLLIYTQGMLCGDWRDRVYSLVGLANTAASESDLCVIPDYEKRVDEVWETLFMLYVQATGDLSPLSYAKKDVDFDPPLATWAPRWPTCNASVLRFREEVETHSILRQASWKLNRSRDCVGDQHKPLLRSASGETPTQACFPEISKIFCARGISVARITTVDEYIRSSILWSFTHCRELIISWGQFAGLDRLALAISNIFDDGLEPSSPPDSQHASLQTADTELSAQAKITSYLQFLADTNVDITALARRQPDFGNFASQLIKRCKGRQLYLTDRNEVGLGPQILCVRKSGIRVGDIVCVLYGGPVPYILRPIADQQYVFVGETYTHGLMNGEALIGLAAGKYAEKDFNIR